MPEKASPKAICILHANCLGDMLRPLLESIPAFSRLFTIRQYTNYTGDKIPESAINKCSLYLYQYLAPKWGTLSTERMLARLPDTCTSIELPNFLFKGYWPFWQPGTKIIDFCNTIIEELLHRDLSADEVLHLYLRGDTHLFGDIATDVESMLLQLEKNDKNKAIPYAHIVADHWKEEQLFITVNHPGERLVFHVATRILHLLALGSLPEACKRQYVHPHGDFWQPIHPKVGEALQLPFAGPSRRYRIFKNMLTHREYTVCYLACRANGEKNLLTMLNSLPQGYRP